MARKQSLPLRTVCSALAATAIMIAYATTATAGSAQTLCTHRQQQMAQPYTSQDVVKAWLVDYDRLTRPRVASKVFEVEHIDDHVDWARIKPDPDEVTVDLYVNSIWDIDQRAGSFKLRCYLRMRYVVFLPQPCAFAARSWDQGNATRPSRTNSLCAYCHWPRWIDERLCFNGSSLPPTLGSRLSSWFGGSANSSDVVIELDKETMLNQSTGMDRTLLLLSHFFRCLQRPDETAAYPAFLS